MNSQIQIPQLSILQMDDQSNRSTPDSRPCDARTFVLDVQPNHFNERYIAYQSWCNRVGVPFADYERWERVNRQITEDTFESPPGRNGILKNLASVLRG